KWPRFPLQIFQALEPHQKSIAGETARRPPAETRAAPPDETPQPSVADRPARTATEPLTTAGTAGLAPARSPLTRRRPPLEAWFFPLVESHSKQSRGSLAAPLCRFSRLLCFKAT